MPTEKLHRIVKDGTSNGLLFWCPGCNHSHRVVYGNDQWAWNNDLDKPTFTPSVLVSYYKPTVEGLAMMARMDKLPVGVDRYPGTDETCHSYVTNGKIQFLSDCTHTLVNQTVDLPEWSLDSVNNI